MEGFLVTVDVTVSGVAATIAPEGIFSLVKNMQLQVNDGGSTRNVLNADSLSITQRALNYGGNLDTATLAAYSAAFGGTTTYRFAIEHKFAPLALEDPSRSNFLLNLPRFNSDPVLSIQIASQSEVDVNGTPTFAISAGTLTVIPLKRYVDAPNWTYFDTEFISSIKAYPNNAARQRYDIPVPGYHFSVGARPYTSATALGDITQSEGTISIQALNTFQRQIQPKNLKILNQASIGSDVLTTANGTQRAIANSSYWFDYLSDLNGASAMFLDGLLDTNPFVSVGQGPQVIWDITGGTGVQVVYMHDIAYGDLSALMYIRGRNK